MLRRIFLVGVATIWAAACSHDLGPPRVKPLPAVDHVPAVRNGAPRSPRIANYKLDARLDAATHQITATETLTWTNPGASAVDMLPFHLYMNAFKNESSLFMRTSRGEMRGAKASDTAWGWIQIDSLQIAGVELATKLAYPGAPDETVADLPLAQPIEPGQTVEIAFKFTEQLPEVFARSGYKDDFNMVGQWFPKIGVRVGAPGLERWECQPHQAFTEFFADFGTYDVTLTVPSTHTVAATGVLVAATEAPGNMHTLTYHAEDVHDFAWMADPYMQVLKGQATVEDGTVAVRIYYRPEQEAFAQRHLQAAIGAIEKFSAYFVPYPWPIMSVIDPPPEAANGAGGMEYPTLVTTAGDSVFMRPGVYVPEFVTVHEIGHNWFQGMLASNEPVEAWLDEGVNEWADTHVMADLYGARTSIVDWLGFQADYVSASTAFTDPTDWPSPIATAAYDFVDGDNYGQATYFGTQRALTTLERETGTTKFMAAMKAYARAWAFKHPTGRDFFAALERGLDQNLDWFVAPTFEQVGGMRLSVRDAGCRPVHEPRGVFDDGAQKKKTRTEADAPDTGAWECEVTVENTGVVHVPVDVELHFADGSTQRLAWDDRGQSAWQRFTVEHSSKLVAVRLDPDNKVKVDSPIQHQYRLEGDGAASLRASARIASWVETAMQMVGP